MEIDKIYNMERKSRLNAGLFSSTTDQWATPQDFFDKLDAEFHFSLDPCASEDNAKCKKYFTEEDNGLIQNWGGGKEYFAILRMEEKSPNGYANAARRARNPIPYALCLSLLARTPHTSTITSITRQKSASSGAGSSSGTPARAHPSLQWS